MIFCLLDIALDPDRFFTVVQFNDIYLNSLTMENWKYALASSSIETFVRCNNFVTAKLIE